MRASYFRLIKTTLILIVSTSSLQIRAQAPDTIAGRTIQLTATSGTFPFASSGSSRFLPSAIDSSYAIVPVSGNIAASDGSYSYSRTSSNTATLTANDSFSGPLRAICTYTSAAGGTYVLTSLLDSSAKQTGTFLIYSGPSPAAIAGRTFTVTITSGKFPFSDTGGYQFITAPTGNTFTVVGFGGVSNSSGTYSYTKNSPTTGLLTFVDGQVGSGFSQELSFDSASTGSAYLRANGGSGYQTALFSMSEARIPPTISDPPQSRTVNEGANVTFSVTATGSGTLGYQWRKNGSNISGANSSSLSLNNVLAADAGNYSVLVSNSAGSVSAAASLTVIVAPHITYSPTNVVAKVGGMVTLSCVATGSSLQYQWCLNSADIVGATSATYSLANVQINQSGTYSVRVSNQAGSITSSPAVVSVWKTAVSIPILAQPSIAGPGTNRLLNLEIGARYKLQSSPNLFRWFDVTNFVAEGANAEIVRESTTNMTKIFHRIISPE